jgi:hypothetical protein
MVHLFTDTWYSHSSLELVQLYGVKIEKTDNFNIVLLVDKSRIFICSFTLFTILTLYL